MSISKPSEIVFANDNLEKEFYNLDDSEEIKKYLIRAIKDITKNAFCRI